MIMLMMLIKKNNKDKKIVKKTEFPILKNMTGSEGNCKSRKNSLISASAIFSRQENAMISNILKRNASCQGPEHFHWHLTLKY